jgi:hypothetical protein
MSEQVRRSQVSIGLGKGANSLRRHRRSWRLWSVARRTMQNSGCTRKLRTCWSLLRQTPAEISRANWSRWKFGNQDSPISGQGVKGIIPKNIPQQSMKPLTQGNIPALGNSALIAKSPRADAKMTRCLEKRGHCVRNAILQVWRSALLLTLLPRVARPTLYARC